MRKFIIICVLFGAVCSVLQKKGQLFIKSMGYSQPDNDPNSSTRKLAAQERKRIEGEETAKRTVAKRNITDFDRRMKALGVLPLSVPAKKMAIYVFNDSTRKITFSFLHADGTSTGDSDVLVEANSHGNTEIDCGGIVYILAKGTSKRWRLDMSRPLLMRDYYGGCVYSD